MKNIFHQKKGRLSPDKDEKDLKNDLWVFFIWLNLRGGVNMVGFVWFCIGAVLGADVVLLVTLMHFEKKEDFTERSEEMEDKEKKKARSPPVIRA